MADWYSSGHRDQLMSLHSFDSMLGYSSTSFPVLQPPDLSPNTYPAVYSHAHSQAQAAAAAAYSLQRQQHFGFGDQQWRQGPDVGTEMRKEKSRDAARSRRGKENTEFYELAKMLPLPVPITSQLDKASIIRLTISYLRLRDFTKSGEPAWGSGNAMHKGAKGLRGRNHGCFPVDIFDIHQGTHILQALDGFAFSLADDGRFLYISETVSVYLGLSQVEMAGSSVFEYIHQDDHEEVAEQLELTLTSASASSSVASALVNSSLTASSSPSSLASDDGSSGAGSNSHMLATMNPDGKKRIAAPMTLGPNSVHKGYDRAFCIRMKSTLTKRGCHFKSSGYRVVLVLGHLRPKTQYQHHRNLRKSPTNLMGMVGLAIALPSPSANELRLESDMFVSRINFDFRLAHCEPKVSDLLHYTPEELQGRSLYSLCHAQDLEKLRKTHTDLLKKGQVLSPYYRLLNRTGGYVWLQTCATVICNSKNSEDQNIICVNYVLSGPVDDTIILDHHQLDPSLGVRKTEPAPDFPSPLSPDKTGSEPPCSRGAPSPSVKPPTPSLAVPALSTTPPHLESGHDLRTHDPMPHDGHHSTMHEHHDTHSTATTHDTQHDLRPHNTHMEQDGVPLPHELRVPPHGAPLTPQLTPVSHGRGGLTDIDVKTETSTILTVMNVNETMEDMHRPQNLSPMASQNHLQYSSCHPQLSPASTTRYSPVSSTQLSPSTHFASMDKIPHQDMDGSVRHLEAAMTRHLPNDGAIAGVVNAGLGSVTGGFSAIQWASRHDNQTPTIFQQLRTVKRESVIKAPRDPHDVGNTPCPTTGTLTPLSLPSATSGVLPTTGGYHGYHISPPASVSPDRLKAMPCDPYTDIYNSPVYQNNTVTSKNSYDNVRWYST